MQLFRHSLKFGVVVILLCPSFSARSQSSGPRSLRQQLTFLCDNNFFLLNGEDGYYTSGMFLKYDRVSKKSSNISKKILSYEIGQEIYNAHARKILRAPNSRFPGGIEEIDRPIAGYLFGKITRSSFYNDKRLLTLGFSIGTVGKNSFGQDVQEFWHRVIGVKDYWNWVWDYQVSNEVGANLHVTFANALLSRDQDFIQITPITQATLGTTFTNVSQAFLMQIGRLRPMSSSTFWNSRVQLPNEQSHGQLVEMFLFYKPSIKYQLYNATIQGGMFTTNKGPILSDVQPFVIAHEVGLRFSTPRFGLGYHMVFQGKEAKSQFYQQSFASIVGSICF